MRYETQHHEKKHNYNRVSLKDRLLWFEADFVKRLYLWRYYWDVDI